MAGQSGIAPLGFRDAERLSIRIGAEVRDWDPLVHLPAARLPLYDRVTQYALVAGAEAADVEPDEASTAPKASVEDLFAKLRAARADSVIERVVEAVAEEAAANEAAAAEEEGKGDAEDEQLQSRPQLSIVTDSTVQLDVFQKSPEAPVVVAEADDSAFGKRDAELTPLIVAGARKLKRVLADEQNDDDRIGKGTALAGPWPKR